MALTSLQSTSVFYRRILSQFPSDISLAFAYGSGVFKQAGTSKGQMRVRSSNSERNHMSLKVDQLQII